MDDAAQSIESIFAEALLQPGPAQRSAFLTGVCGNDARVRARVEALLEAHDDAGSFLTPPPGGAEFATLDGNAGVDGAPPRRPSRPVWENPLAEKPGAVIGQYKLLQQIGEGGFGIVWMADQEKPVRRRVARRHRPNAWRRIESAVTTRPTGWRWIFSGTCAMTW